MSNSFLVAAETQTLTEEDLLLRCFYGWEYRGRGWVLYDAPVELEPPFRPFSWYLPPRSRSRIPDDGRRHTFLSGLIAGIRERLVGAAIHPEEPPFEDPEEPDPALHTESRTLIEIQVTLPPQTKISKETTTQFLRSLTHCRHPLAFEIIGTQGEVVFQITCGEEDYSQVENQIEGQFPDSVLTAKSGFLGEAWGAAGDEAVVVEFGLSHEFMLPLATSRNFDPDPLTAVVGALSDVREGETGVFQILFQPVSKPWAESILRSVAFGDSKPVFEDFPDILPLAKEKVSSPLYACIVRVAGRSPKVARAWKIVRGLGAALLQYSLPSGNEFIPLTNEGYEDYDQQFGLLLRYSHRSGMLLNLEELLSLAHLPSASLRSKKLKRVLTATRPAPETTVGHSFVLGENFYNGVATTVSLNPEQRSRHLYAIGASGGGKSSFLLHLIRQDLEQGNGFALLDPHGDLVDAVLGLIPPNRLDDAILFDPSDAEYPIGLNILKAHSELEKSLLSSDLVSVFRRQSTSWGDQMTSVLGNAIQAFLESTTGGTLNDMERFLTDREYRIEFLKTVQDLEIVYYWMKTFPLLSGRPQSPITTRLNTFFKEKRVRYMIAQKESRLSARRVMDEGKILLARLSQGAIGEENAYLLGSLLISQIHQAAMSRQDQRESERRPFYLYIDECHDLITPSVSAILSGARKYKLSLILAHQYLDQLGKNDLASSALANPFTRVVFKVSDQDAKKFAEGFSHYNADDLKNLGVGEAVARVERAEYDFNLSVPRLPAISERTKEMNREYILRNTRERYATPRAVVEASLAPRYADLFDLESPPSTSRRKKTTKKEFAASEPQETETEPQPVEVRVEPRADAGLVDEPTVKEAGKEGIPTARPKSVFPALPGRGKREHKYLQQLVKHRGEDHGYLVTIEKLLPGGGSVDVALESAEQRIAVEISVTSTPTQEMANVRKCLEAGFVPVFLLVEEEKKMNVVSRKLDQELTPEERNKVHVVQMSDLYFHLEEQAALRQNRTETIRGRTVNKTYRPLQEKEKDAKKRAVSEVISKVMMQGRNRHLKGGGDG